MARRKGYTPEEPERRPERPSRDGRERQVHEELARRRVEGGEPPTQAAYARALEQLAQLPGSVMRPPTDVAPLRATSPAPEGERADPGEEE